MDHLCAAKSYWDCAFSSGIFYFNSCFLSAPWDANDAASTLQLKGCGAAAAAAAAERGCEIFWSVYCSLS